MTRLLLAAAALLAVMPFPANAQARPSTPLGTSRTQPRQPRIEVGVGAGFLGGLALGERVCYLWCPDGVIKSRLMTEVGRAVGDGITSRNWSTIQKLHGLVQAD